MIRYLFIPFFLLCCLYGYSQQNSENGWSLRAHDSLRVLVVFVEVEYDTLPELADVPEGRDEWRVGELPAYADSLFDPWEKSEPYGVMTRYFQEMSLGNFKVMGDYIPTLYRVNYSDIMRGGTGRMFQLVSEQMAADSVFVTANGLGLKDFDFWEDSPGSGQVKPPSKGSFQGVDHVMVLQRNYHKLRKGHGRASGSSFGMVGGKRTDSYSVFNGGHGLPFHMARHEMAHLLIGGNNFHAGGGNGPKFTSYFPSIQGGWSMLGAANSSFLTCSGWDRFWLGWKNPENQFEISARDENRKEVNSDIDISAGRRIFILRDFVTTGDAIRIRLPFIPEEEYQQWLWLENHTTQLLNNSPFDVFRYQHYDCVDGAKPGIYANMQIESNEKNGGNIYGKVRADYLRPLPADGIYDFMWEPEKDTLEPCVNPYHYYAYYCVDEFENPFSGNHALEIPYYWTDQQQLSDDNTRTPFTRRVGDEYERIALMGNARNGFRELEKKTIGIGTNPASSNMLTLLNTRRPTRADNRDNRKIYLSGLHVEILETFADGTIKLEVRFDDNLLTEKRRWCAPEIVLGNHMSNDADLIVENELRLDYGKTMTRFDLPDTVKGKLYFSDPTVLRVSDGAEMEVRSSVILENQSQVKIDRGGTLHLKRKSRVMIKSGEVYFARGAIFEGKGRFKIKKGAIIKCGDKATYKAVRKRTCNKRRVLLVGSG